jgi:putative phage-type endonuclease
MNSAYTIVDLQQGTTEWLEWRSNGIGASDAPTIMGENPWKRPAQLLSEKLGASKKSAGNAAMARGTALEPEARRRYERISGNSVEPACLQSNKHAWQRASLDGLSADRNTVVEIKVGDSVYKNTASTRQVPRYYVGQLQHILAVTALPHIDFFCWLPNRPEIGLRVMRDDSYIARLIAAEQNFWQQLLAQGR